MAKLTKEAKRHGLDLTLDQWTQAAVQLRHTLSASIRAAIIRCQRAGYRPHIIGSMLRGPIGWRRL